MVDTVNIVASGHFGRELNLAILSADLNVDEISYEPESSPGLQVRFEPDGPMATIYSTGSYIIMGAKSGTQLITLHEQITAALSELGIDVDLRKSSPEIKNLVCKERITQKVNLEALIVELGKGETDYDPEQSPFVYYRPEKLGCVITIPANGKVVVTGVTETEEAERAIEYLQQKAESIL